MEFKNIRFRTQPPQPSPTVQIIWGRKKGEVSEKLQLWIKKQDRLLEIGDQFVVYLTIFPIYLNLN